MDGNPIATAGGLVLAAVASAALLYALYHRPQRGLLLVAALTPFHGLTLIVSHGETFVIWKEVVLALAALATFVSPNRRSRAGVSLPWLPAAVIFAVIGSVSAVVALGIDAVYPVKITFFYLFMVTFIVWRSPLTARDRDHLVSIIMAVSTVTAAWGIAQQFLGAEFLVGLGYKYNDVIRTSGSFLRSFSTFVQPFPFGLYVLMALLVGGAVALQDTTRVRNKLFLLASPILTIGMGVSIVRAAYLGLIVGLLWLALHRHRYLFGVLAAGAVAGLFGFLYAPAKALESLFSSSSLGERTDGWSQIGLSVLHNPFGRGLGATGSAAEKLATEGGITDDYLTLLQKLNPALAYQPDNYYVKILFEIGPIGLWALLLLLAAVTVSTLRASRLTVGADSALCLGVSASVVAACAASLVSTYFEIFPLDFYFWLLVGAVGCAVAQRHDDQPSAGDADVSSMHDPGARSVGVERVEVSPR